MAFEDKLNYCHTRFGDYKGGLIWKISGFIEQCPLENGEKFESSTFRVAGDESDWSINMYPKGERGKEGYVSIFLKLIHKKEVDILCEFSIVDASGKKTNTHRFSKFYNLSEEVWGNWGFSEFISLDELLVQKLKLLPGDELTVSCNLTIKKKVAITGKCSDISKDPIDDSSSNLKENSLNQSLASLFNEKKNTDAVLKVGSEQILCHKIILTCRSPVFACMFEHYTLEKETSEVIITDVDVDVLNELIRFMYTDEIALKDINFTLQLLVASDKYDVRPLKTRCAKYLNAKVSASNVFRVLTIADACNQEELVQICMRIIVKEMGSVANLADWISQMSACPQALASIQEQLSRKSELNTES